MELVKLVTEQLAAQGTIVLLLMVGIWYLNRQNQERDKVSREALAALHQERSDRIKRLEDDVQDCKTDRRLLWDKVLAATPPEPLRVDTTRRSA